MTKQKIQKLSGTLRIIGDKSISHRALILSSISNGKAEITNLLESEDVISTVNILKEKVSDHDLTLIRELLYNEDALPVNVNYRDFVFLWKWLSPKRVLFAPQDNAISHRKYSFNILFNERFSRKDIKRIVECLKSIELRFL